MYIKIYDVNVNVTMMKNNNGATTVMLLGVAGVGLSMAMFADNFSKWRIETQTASQPTSETATSRVELHDPAQSPMRASELLPIPTSGDGTTLERNPADDENEPFSESDTISCASNTSLEEDTEGTDDEDDGEQTRASSNSNHSKNSRNSEKSRISSARSRSGSTGPRHREPPTNKPRDPVSHLAPSAPTTEVADGSTATRRRDRRTPHSGTSSSLSPGNINRPLTYREMYLKKKLETEKADENMILEDNRYKGDGSQWSKRMYFLKEAYRRSRERTPIDPLIQLNVAIETRKQQMTSN